MRLLPRLGVGTLAVLVVMAVSPVRAQADEVRENQWMLDALYIDKVHDITKGEGVTVGIIDSGVDATHPDLTGNVEPGQASWPGGEDGLNDTIGHGTAMASLIVGHGHGPNGEDGVLGIAPEAKVKSVAIYPTSDPREDAGGAHDRMVEGIRWLADQGVDVISISLGGAGTGELEASVEYAVEDKDVPIVASAGNSGKGLADDVVVQAPATYDNVFGVTGSSKEGEFWEGSVDATSPDNVTVAAPAEDVVHAWNDHGYDDNSGTSDSAAIVAGTVALMKAQWPDMPWELIEWRLALTADDAGKKGPDSKTGFGIVNPYAALTEDVKLPEGYSDAEVNPEPNPRSSDSAEESATELTAEESPAALWWIVGAVAVLAIVAVALLVWVKRRKKTKVATPSHSEPFSS